MNDESEDLIVPTAAGRATTSKTRLPILIGVLGGMLTYGFLAHLESPSFYRLTVWIFDERSPKTLFITPGYYCVHRTIFIVLCAIGGSIGIVYSHWGTKTGFLFLSGILLVIVALELISAR